MEEQIRLEAFKWLKEQQLRYGDTLPREILAEGFSFQGEQIRLMGPQGIFKPRAFARKPISITTTVKSPYEDALMVDGFIHYKYRGMDPNHQDNRGLREAMNDETPLIYFHATRPGQYVAIWPVYIVSDDPVHFTFLAVADEQSTAYITAANRLNTNMPLEMQQDMFGKTIGQGGAENFLQGEVFPYQSTTSTAGIEIRRSYATILAKQRLFQHTFRDIVLQAYQKQCAFCHLRHTELLDAAHIIPDSLELGRPVVNNGMSLCKIHHAAFDANIIGIRPDHIVEVNGRVLEEVDGPMLKYGIQSMHLQKIILPRHQDEWPDDEKLRFRYEQFRAG